MIDDKGKRVRLCLRCNGSGKIGDEKCPRCVGTGFAVIKQEYEGESDYAE